MNNEDEEAKNLFIWERGCGSHVDVHLGVSETFPRRSRWKSCFKEESHRNNSLRAATRDGSCAAGGLTLVGGVCEWISGEFNNGMFRPPP